MFFSHNPPSPHVYRLATHGDAQVSLAEVTQHEAGRPAREKVEVGLSNVAWKRRFESSKAAADWAAETLVTPQQVCACVWGGGDALTERAWAG